MLLLLMVQDLTIPQALNRMWSSRQIFKSGRIEYMVNGSKFVNRYATNGDRILDILGDFDGVVTPAHGDQEASKLPIHLLYNSDGDWFRHGGNLSASLWETRSEDAPPRRLWSDARFMGMDISLKDAKRDAGNAPWSDLPVIGWDERTDSDGRYVVQAHLAGGREYVWTINPAKGWNAESVAAVDNGTIVAQTVIELSESNGAWFPSVVYYGIDGAEPQVVTITSAEFNAESDKERFTPADAGMEPGANVTCQERRVQLYWTGKDMVAFSDYVQMVKNKTIEPGPIARRLYRGEPNPYLTEKQRGALLRERASASQPTENALWLEYVNMFVAAHRLNKEQEERARAILKDCQEMARSHVKGKLELLEEAAKHAEANHPDGNREIEQRVSKLQDSIDRIFETQLKPRLEAIPSRQQKERAEQVKAGKPV
jgi:hypothetical protein